MLYMLLIHANEADWSSCSASEQAAVMQLHEKLETDLRKAGKYVGCNALGSAGDARTVRFRDGKSLVTDGPYAESKEQFGGYYIVDAESIDDAVSIAARIPGVMNRAIEVRAVQQTG